MDAKQLTERIAGCLLGGAVGDALGAPLEGLWSVSIPPADQLLEGFREVEGYPEGQYTDDTQLTLATVDAVLEAGEINPHAVMTHIAALWQTQTIVGPGGACTRAAWNFLAGGDWQTCGAPEGQAGNGTAMRTAIIGVLLHDRPDELPSVAADISRLTHSDPRSIAGGVAIARAAQWMMAHEGPLDRDAMLATIADDMNPIEPDFAQLVRGLPEWLRLPDPDAIARIAPAGQPQAEFATPIITPFVVPTVLAGLWAIARFPDDWATAVTSVIGLGGDVDTLAAIVGGVLGARLGVGAIPPQLADAVLDSDAIRQRAARLSAWVRSRS